MIKKTLLVVFALGATLSQAYVVVDKAPNTGGWSPLGQLPFTRIYANSFIHSGATGDVATVGGAYVQSSGQDPSTFQFLLLADGGNAPTSTVLASSAFVSDNSGAMTLVTSALSSNSLVNGQRYWLALSAVGGSGVDAYSLGGHTQNSVYADNGTFWFSNAGDLNNWDGQAFTPEISIYVEAQPVPEPATMAVLGVGALALLRRRKKSA
ncbi:MAG: PEP-CTERM sorting domain-containing protein [Fimbriimonadaceae bacterium]|nr:PEP-CTERM sorting domain-containing protein [Fimbriimonadaceae bacterium]